MELPPLADVLIPLGAGLVVAVLALVVLTVWRRRVGASRSRATAAAVTEAFPSVEAELEAERPAAPPPAPGPAPAAPEAAYPAYPDHVDHIDHVDHVDHTGPARAVEPVLPPSAPVPARSGEGPARSPSPVPRRDPRDRLLAVLLHDPVTAVGAAVELEACRGRLDHLSVAMRQERDVLGAVLARLSGTGLRVEQLARLAGLPLEEVRGLLQVYGHPVVTNAVPARSASMT